LSDLFTGSSIEVYTSALSGQAGDEIALHVSTTAQLFDLRVSRIGREEVTVWERTQVPGAFYPTPDDACANGCGWPAALSVTIEDGWRSGYYQVTATTADDDGDVEEYVAFFVVRATTSRSPILFVLATNTYAAYNFYGTGSLYVTRDGSPGNEPYVSMHRPWIPGFLRNPEGYDRIVEARRQNFDPTDPLLRDRESGVPWLSCAAGFGNWELVMVEWLERNGYEVDYAVQSDLDYHPDLLSGYGLMLSVGHDEYWSWLERDAVEAFIAGGGNVCFFSGNAVCWQVRLDDDGARIYCYKENFAADPVVQAGDPRAATTFWLADQIERPESRLTGQSFWFAGMSRFYSAAPNGPGGFLVYRPEHWIFEGAGVGYGDCLGQRSAILHYEVDGCPIRFEKGLPYPEDFHDAHPSLEIVGLAPASFVLAEGDSVREYMKTFGVMDPQVVDYVEPNRGHATMTMYTDNGTVFAAGTTDWTNGLTGDDPAVEQVTRNLLDRLSAR
jgi:hypothetical protein